jgi:hypothetical protein
VNVVHFFSVKCKSYIKGSKTKKNISCNKIAQSTITLLHGSQAAEAYFFFFWHVDMLSMERAETTAEVL